MRILAIGAHPDDLEIFIYGLLACLSARGDEIILAVATDGAAGTIAGSGGERKLASQRAEETRDGLCELGTPLLLGLPDGQLHSHPGASQLIADHITRIAPDLIITHDSQDYHPDHRALSRFVTQGAGFRCPVLYADTLMGVGFTPEIYVDITPHFPAKQKAILAHQSQLPEKFAEAAALHNRFRAAQCNAPANHYAECYRAPRLFPFADIRDLLPPAPAYRPFYLKGSGGLI